MIGCAGLGDPEEQKAGALEGPQEPKEQKILEAKDPAAEDKMEGE